MIRRGAVSVIAAFIRAMPRACGENGEVSFGTGRATAETTEARSFIPAAHTYIENSSYQR